jgi:hypothetical protein
LVKNAQPVRLIFAGSERHAKKTEDHQMSTDRTEADQYEVAVLQGSHSVSQQGVRTGARCQPGRARGIRLPSKWRLRALLVVGVVGLSALGSAMLLPEAAAVTGGSSGWSNHNAVGKVINSDGSICTGTVIDDIARSSGERQGILVTAGHCKVESGNKVTFFEFENGDGRPTVQASVVDVRNHPQGADIKLARISFGRPGRDGFNFPGPVSAVEYGVQGNGTPATLVGYGYFEDGGQFRLPKNQRQGTGQISSLGRPSGFTEDRYLITGFAACGGDSGGPILVNDKIIGVQTNAGDGNLNGGTCGTTSIALPLFHVRDWIESTRNELRG